MSWSFHTVSVGVAKENKWGTRKFRPEGDTRLRGRGQTVLDFVGPHDLQRTSIQIIDCDRHP
jgi:hypothetical protein